MLLLATYLGCCLDLGSEDPQVALCVYQAFKIDSIKEVMVSLIPNIDNGFQDKARDPLLVFQ